MASRDIALAELTGGVRPHRAHERAADAGMRSATASRAAPGVTCEVDAAPFRAHRRLARRRRSPYDTNVKMNPPLREAADGDAMLDGVDDGTVDVIATDHAPHHDDEKQVEFDQAPFGITGLETAVSLASIGCARRAYVSCRGWSSCCR